MTSARICKLCVGDVPVISLYDVSKAHYGLGAVINLPAPRETSAGCWQNCVNFTRTERMSVPSRGRTAVRVGSFTDCLSTAKYYE